MLVVGGATNPVLLGQFHHELSLEAIVRRALGVCACSFRLGTEPGKRFIKSSSFLQARDCTAVGSRCISAAQDREFVLPLNI